MIENLVHTNHNGDILDFVKSGIFVNMNDLRDFTWSIDAANNSINGFYKEVAPKTIPVVIKKNVNLIDNVIDHFESDVHDKKPGFFVVNGYEFYCYCTSVKYSDYDNDKFIVAELGITSDNPIWIKKHKISFYSTSVPDGTSYIKRYAYHYPYRYRANVGVKNLFNNLPYSSHFMLIIYGPVENPSITINGHIYQIFTDIGDNERIVINYSSNANKTVFKYLSNGDMVNIFNYRNKEVSVFKKISPGNQLVSWSGLFSFDIVLFEERSSPKWG